MTVPVGGEGIWHVKGVTFRCQHQLKGCNYTVYDTTLAIDDQKGEIAGVKAADSTTIGIWDVVMQ